MAKRTKSYIKIPWTGGINTSVDPGMLNDNDLVVADNVVFSSSGSRLKREGHEYLDAAVPAPTHSESSGTTRTLYFEGDDDLLTTSSTTDEKLVVGEKITVAGDADFATTDATVISITATASGHSITYTASSSLTQAKTATALITVKRAAKYLDSLDYWYVNSSNVKTQLTLAISDQGKLFSFDAQFRRTEIDGQPEVSTVTCAAASTLTTGDYFYLYSADDETAYYVWYNVAAGGGDPALSGKTGIEVAVGGADTDAQVATTTAAAIDAIADFTASADTTVVTITNARAGITTAATDENTGFTFATTSEGATLADSATQVTSTVFNNRALFSFDTVGAKTIKYYPLGSAKYELLDGDPPDASFMYEYQGRLWCNDKTDKDRLHYSSPGNHEQWLGIGDSGAIDISGGDGDPRGIVTVFAYKGILFIPKGTKTHRLLGTTPENYRVESVTKGLGAESAGATVPVDQDDVVFLSKRGFHSIAATDQYGDTEAAFLSKNIQPTFNKWAQAYLKNTQGAYIPELNSIAFSVTEDGKTVNNALWLYNIDTKGWYRWPNISCVSLTTRISNGETKLLIGTEDSRLIQAQRGTFRDFDDSPISYRVKTGTIYPGGDPQSIKAFKKLSLVFRPNGNFQFTVKVKVDNFATQSLSFQQESNGAKLGTDFVLGESVLGVANVLAPHTQQIDGYGRGLTLEITQTGTDEQVEIFGFIVEYEDADLEQETKGS